LSRSVLADVVDQMLEASVIGSFSRLGPVVRSHLSNWTIPETLQGKSVVITGATSGIGLTTASLIARGGASVRFVARDTGRARDAVDRIHEFAPGSDVDFYLADIGDLGQVRALADQMLSRGVRLDVLIHNAGSLNRTFEMASCGVESTIASQLAGPFLMTGLLLPLLGIDRSRVLQVSSGGMYTQRFDLRALDVGETHYKGTTQYARVKRAQLVLMGEWARRIGDCGTSFHAMHPGWVDTPGLRSGLPGFYKLMRPMLRTPEQGADTLVWLAGCEEAESVRAGFWLDRKQRSEYKLPWTRPDYESGPQQSALLWDWCAEICGWDLPKS
jgi:NAD(P)-dependent dehydrogenase (short-subunit alcohol dehydrogenase family)